MFNVHAYHQSASTLNLLRAFAKGGFADLSRAHAWNLEFLDASPEGRRYEALAGEIDRALRFMAACGIDLDGEAKLHEVDFYTSHEALHPRLRGGAHPASTASPTSGTTARPTSLWIGERTRQLDGAHVEFLVGHREPRRREARARGHRRGGASRSASRLNPERRPGPAHAGEPHGRRPRRPTRCRRCCARCSARGHPVVWICDPMHGNTFQHASGYKTRDFDDVMRELHGFFAACDDAGVWPGGVHVELTGENVTECLGGTHEVLGDHLEQRYETSCDPRLNARQSLDLAFQIAELLRRELARTRARTDGGLTQRPMGP